MLEPRAGSITVVGLGPAGAEHITRRSWRVLERAERIHVRTARHPAVAELPESARVIAFDEVYDRAARFEDVYAHIVEALLKAAQSGEQVVYAVPGDPTTGEATVTELVERATGTGIAIELLPAVSFLQPLLAALKLDALDGVQLFDAITVAGYNYPPVNPDFPLVLGQVYSQLLASDLKLALMAVYPDDHPATLVHGAGLAGERIEHMPLYEIDRSPHIGLLTSLYLGPLPQPSGLAALAETAAILRGPAGCPWDQEQTPQSLRPGFLEEVAEVLEALDADDAEALQEELGDVLLHIVMQAQMAREQELFRLSDVVAGIDAKIHRRHPHVWGNWQVQDSAEVMANWEAIKAGEKSDRPASSLLDNLPAALPALSRSQKIQGRVRRVGFDWPTVDGVYDKITEELFEVQQAETEPQRSAEIGDVLFAVVNLARWLDVDAESALREANRRFSSRFRMLEQLARDREVDLAQADLELLEGLWQEAKSLEQEREG